MAVAVALTQPPPAGLCESPAAGEWARLQSPGGGTRRVVDVTVAQALQLAGLVVEVVDAHAREDRDAEDAAYTAAYALVSDEEGDGGVRALDALIDELGAR